MAYTRYKKIWDLPGGKVEKDDSLIETLKREITEEFNVKIEVGKLVFCENVLVNGVRLLIVVFDAKIVSNDPIKLSFENFDYNFISQAEFNQYKFSNWLIKSNLIK